MVLPLHAKHDHRKFMQYDEPVYDDHVRERELYLLQVFHNVRLSEVVRSGLC